MQVRASSVPQLVTNLNPICRPSAFHTRSTPCLTAASSIAIWIGVDGWDEMEKASDQRLAMFQNAIAPSLLSSMDEPGTAHPFALLPLHQVDHGRKRKPCRTPGIMEHLLGRFLLPTVLQFSRQQVELLVVVVVVVVVVVIDSQPKCISNRLEGSRGGWALASWCGEVNVSGREL